MATSNPIRVIIRACVTDIPGELQQRVLRLGSDFCEENLGRPLSIKVQPGGYDALHFLPYFDSSNSVKAYFMYDFNVTGPLDKQELLTVPHKFYYATRQGDSWIFTARDGWIGKAKAYASSYSWGGKTEQATLARIQTA